MAKSPEELTHQEWLGYVQPVGLIVSIPAMLEAQCYVNRNIMAEHARFLSCLPRDKDEIVPEIRDLPTFAQKVLQWEASDLLEVPSRGALSGDMASLEVVLPQYSETLRPTHAVPVFNPNEGQKPWMMLVQEITSGVDLDSTTESDSARHWNAAPQAKFERLLRETGVPIGVLSNRRQLRLVYAPKGESSGHATFNVDEMTQVAGRPMFAAVQMLLCADRMFSLGENQRLPAILENSRKYQNTVSTKLAEQVLAALYELMRGFQAANDVRNGELLRDYLEKGSDPDCAQHPEGRSGNRGLTPFPGPNHVYSGLLTVLMRLVFVMYAEDRDLLSSDPVYSNYYSVTGLFNRLREDAGRHPDTMNQRFGAWSQLITLFRLVYEGGQHGDFKLPARKGYLFDPDRYPFLEGRVESGEWSVRSGGASVASEGRNENDDSELSRSRSLAKSDGPVGGVLPGNEGLPEGRTLRDDQPDSQGSSLDSSQHRRGTRTSRDEGVSELSGDRQGLTDGSGDASDTLPKSRAAAGDGTDQAPFAERPNQPNAGRTSQITSAKSGEGRVTSGVKNPPHTTHHTPPPIPRVSDGVIYNVLRNLLILDGERLSYRTLDVEQIGSVYETVMGFNLEVARGKSIAIKPVKTHGAPATINLDALLATKDKDRAKWLKENADQTLGAVAAKSLKAATTIDELLEALDKKVAKKVTPRVVPAGAIVLQPSDERRRSGSHYTPRSLTEPIVRTTLEPILGQLLVVSSQLLEQEEQLRTDFAEVNQKLAKATRDNPKLRTKQHHLKTELRQVQIDIARRNAAAEKKTPHPEQILQLKVCDPAMGSGAFLVETCRQLADHLVESWHAHSDVESEETAPPATRHTPPVSPQHTPPTTRHYPPVIPPDEDEVLYARRLVAQRCLYGVDKNDMAVDLAKLSLWLVTLAKDHPFTFLDHSLRHGDSLVGLTRRQIIGFHWEPKKQKQFGEDLIQKRLDRATEARAKILNAREDVTYRDQEQKLAIANEALNVVRLTGDACVSAFFAGSKKKEREDRCEELFGDVAQHYQNLKDGKFDVTVRNRIAQASASLRTGEHPIPPFHWEIEFPEVFSRENVGFDAFVGNPPFLGGKRISGAFGNSYRDWLPEIHTETISNSDLVAHFFRRAFDKLRSNGTLGLISTNTLAQGDTRSTGLRWICNNGGNIFSAVKRMPWPGVAAVVVSVAHVLKGRWDGPRQLDAKSVPIITAFLYHAGGHDNPHVMSVNDGMSFQGSIVLGMGFTFDDTDNSGTASPLQLMHELIQRNKKNGERIFPYLGGEEMLRHPKQEHHRYVINFEDLDEDTARSGWPDLMQIVEDRVKPERLKKTGNYKKLWWQFGRRNQAGNAIIKTMDRVLMHPFTSSHTAFAFIPASTIIAGPHCIFTIENYSGFASLQCRVHETWARFTCSTLKDDLSYKISDCFETYPFPPNWKNDAAMEKVGKQYYQYRSDLLVANNEGLTPAYNRFHNRDEHDAAILELRRLHGLMDRAVLEAYGWHDLAESAHCEFLLDYEEDGDSGLGDGGSFESPTPNPKSRKKKPWRLRWPDDFRDEVLARLLELNEQRHKEELLVASSQLSEKKEKKSAVTTKRKPAAPRPLLQDDDQ